MRTNLAAVTSSLKIFHSFRSQTLFLFLSIRTKLNVATLSSSLGQFVIFSLHTEEEKWANYSLFLIKSHQNEPNLLHLPNWSGDFDLGSQKLLELFEKFEFTRFWASFHRSRNIYCTIRSAIFNRCARYVFASIFMNTPTIANWTIALNPLIPAIWCAFRHIPGLCTILQQQQNQMIEAIQ